MTLEDGLSLERRLLEVQDINAGRRWTRRLLILRLYR